MKGNKRNLINFIFASIALSMVIGSAGCGQQSKDVLDTYKQVQSQGDGIKSFTGILLYLT